MKKEFEFPTVEISQITEEDIILTSSFKFGDDLAGKENHDWKW